MDAQHRALFEHFAAFEAAVGRKAGRKELGELLRFLGLYARNHFRAEEALMAEAAFPGAEAHAREHADFIRRLALLVALWEEEQESVAVCTTLASFVREWLVEHVGRADQGIGDHLRRTRALSQTA